MNEYVILINLDECIRELYAKHYIETGYKVIVSEGNILFVKKEIKEIDNVKAEEELTKYFVSYIKKIKIEGLLIIDLSKEVEESLKDIGDKKFKVDKFVSWRIRQAVTKAELEKRKGYETMYDKNV